MAIGGKPWNAWHGMESRAWDWDKTGSPPIQTLVSSVNAESGLGNDRKPRLFLMVVGLAREDLLRFMETSGQICPTPDLTQ